MPHIYSPQNPKIRRWLAKIRHFTRRKLYRTKHDILARISFQYQQSSTLLTIPAEIRLLIYSLVFTYPALVDSIHTHPDSESYMSTKQILQPLLTCRQIYNEANIQAFKLATFIYRFQRDMQEPKIPPSVLSKVKADAVRSLTIIDDTLECNMRRCHPFGSWYQRLLNFQPHRIGLEALEEIIVCPEPVIKQVTWNDESYLRYEPYLTRERADGFSISEVVLAFMWNIPTLKRLVLCDISMINPDRLIDSIVENMKLRILHPYPSSSRGVVFSPGYAQWARGLQVVKVSHRLIVRGGNRGFSLMFISPCFGHPW